MRKYLDEVHVMLYHSCSDAACINAEVKELVSTLDDLGLKKEDVLKVIERVFGFGLKMEEIDALDKGIDLERFNTLIDLSKEIYKDSFISILWVDNAMLKKLGYYVDKFKDVDLFAP